MQQRTRRDKTAIGAYNRAKRQAGFGTPRTRPVLRRVPGPNPAPTATEPLPRTLAPLVPLTDGGDAMRLAEIIELRPVPAAGLLATLTRRCPLSCAHCSTSSGTRGEDTPAAALRRFVGGFTARNRPDVLMLTGGEPLLRPALVGELAMLAAPAGTRTSVLSGMFFAADGRVPDRIMRALGHVEHFSASIDVFHEREVPRAAAFRAVHLIMESGIDVSFHVVGDSVDDPYLADITASIRAEFRDRAAVLVNHVRPVGRAAGWAAARTAQADGAGAKAGALRDGGLAGGRLRRHRHGLLQSGRGGRPPGTRASAPGTHRHRRLGADTEPLPGLTRTAHHPYRGRHLLCRLPWPGAAARGAGRRGTDRSRPAAGAMDALGARLQRDAGAEVLMRRYGSEPYAPLVLLGGPVDEEAPA